MKIQQHPRMQNIWVGDQVISSRHHLFSFVEEVFPAAVCVKVPVISLDRRLELAQEAQLWRADEIENLSTCRHCGSREDLQTQRDTGVPFRVCLRCRPFETDEGHTMKAES